MEPLQSARSKDSFQIGPSKSNLEIVLLYYSWLSITMIMELLILDIALYDGILWPYIQGYSLQGPMDKGVLGAITL